MVESDGIRQNLLDEVTGDDSNYMPPMGDPETGLTEHEVSIRRAHFGYNELADKEENILLKFLSYFWGPMPIMIWIAILVEFINEEWPDFGVLLFLQVVNGCVGFFEEQEAGDAIAALKDKLAPKCTVRREGVFKTIEARDLVPGDVVNLKLGDIIPADCLLLEGHPLEVDQAALTGESLPVTIYPHESLKMGATIKRGENLAHVTATGSNTFFGKAASMVASVESQGRFQLVLFKISMVLLSISVVATLVILITLLSRDVSILRAIGVCVVLLVASIPIAMQVVSTSTMAMGARKLAEKNVIVAKLSAIEEMAGMKILCSDKTGTLTQNKLELNDPIVFSPTPMNGNELFFLAALAAKRMEEGMDAIDTCICQTLSRVDPSLWREVEESYEELDFHPFDPVSKFTAATVRGPDGVVFKTMKGAPQVVLRMCNPSPDLEARVSAAVQDLADRGYRAIGVAKTDESSNWVFTGVLSLFDPPRIDTEMTIKEAQKMGIEVKMITGDQLAIAKETCRQLGMGTNILGVELLDAAGGNIPGVSGAISDIVRDCNGFAEVFPEHKFQIVSILMESGFICGMTGDGVNDAPALKRANIGIAVADSTDAARAASDIVLTEPGLKEIIDALVNSRKIFSRVRNYCMYRISATLSLVGFFFVAVLAYNPENYFPSKQRNIGTSSTLFSDESSDEHESVFTLPVIALVMITILNDGTIITICRDYVVPSQTPQKWNLPEIFAVASGLGFVLIVENLLMLLMGFNAGPGDTAGSHCGQRPHDFDYDPAVNTNKCDDTLAHIFGDDDYGTMSYKQVKSLMYLAVSLSSFLTVYSARTRGPFFSQRPGLLLLSASVVSLIITTLFSAFCDDISSDLYMEGLEAKTIFFVWAWCIGFFLVQDLLVKYVCYAVYDHLNADEIAAEEERRRELENATRLEEERQVLRKSMAGSSLHSQAFLERKAQDSGDEESQQSYGSSSLMAGARKSILSHSHVSVFSSLVYGGEVSRLSQQYLPNDVHGMEGGSSSSVRREELNALSHRVDRVEERVTGVEMRVNDWIEEEMTKKED